MKLTQKKIIIITSLLILLACFSAVYLRLFTGKELWYEMFAAVLGVIITAIITMILLRGQSDTDIERERAAKIFEEKLKIYQDYLHTLCNVIEDHSLSDKEKIRLEFQTSYVAMHCDSRYIASVSKAVRELIEYVCPDEESNVKRLNKSNSPDPLLDNLFYVVEAFRKDLYGADFEFDLESKQATLENFSNAYRNAKSQDKEDENSAQHLKVDVNVLSMPPHSEAMVTPAMAESVLDETVPENHSDEDAVAEGKRRWENIVAAWREDGWVIELSEKSGWLHLVNKKGNPGIVSFEKYRNSYRIRACYGNDVDFSNPLKWQKGGRRSGGTWWQNLSEPYCHIEQERFIETIYVDGQSQEYVIGLLKDIKGHLQDYHRTVGWKNKVGSHEGWSVFIWYWTMLACEWRSEEEGNPYMDTIEDGDSGKVLIQFGNRKKDDDLLKKTLKRIGCSDKWKESNGYVILETVSSVDSDVVAERVKYWMDKIAN